MKKIFILLTLLQGIYCIGDAKMVDESTARNVAYSFLSKRSSTLNNAGDLQMVYEATTTVNGIVVPCFYVFNVSSSKGFVIVAGDDNVTPILGYSSSNIFQAQNIRSNVAGWLNNYQKQISYVISQDKSAVKGAAEKWTALLSGQELTAARTTVVNPLITTQWDQEPYYNVQCPYDASYGANAVTGCVATATAQVMKYWNYPKTGNGMHTYIDPTYGTQTVNFGNTSYGWTSMPNYLTTNNSSVAKLMYHVGVAVDMQYGTDNTSGSGSYVTIAESPLINCAEYALKTYFNYSPALHGVSRSGSLYNNSYTETQWTALLQTELNANRPIIYSGYGQLGGHCWVCDGYDNTGMFHFNWGWSGQSDGFYTVDSLAPPALGAGGGGGDFNTDQTVIIGIQPPATATPSTNTIKMNGFITNNTSSPSKYCTGFSLATKFINSGSSSFTGDFCALVFKADDSTFVDTLKVISGQTVAAGVATGTLTFNTTGLYKMVAGLNHIHFYSRPAGGTWSRIADNVVSSSNYINNSNVSVDEMNNLFLSNDLTVTQNSISTTNLVSGKPFTVNGKFAVSYYSSDFNGSLDASLYSVVDGSKVFTIKQLANQSISNNEVSVNFISSNLNIPAGTYVLKITDKGSGQSSFETTSSVFYRNPVLVNVVYPTGVEEVNAIDAVTIYPNPASDIINVNMEGVHALSLCIVDMSGRLVTTNIDVQNKASVSVPTRGFAQGMYFVQINTENGIITKKLVIR